MEQLDTTFWGDERNFRPGVSHMESRDHKLLATRHGRIDCLATIEDTTTFEGVLADLERMELETFSQPSCLSDRRESGRLPCAYW